MSLLTQASLVVTPNGYKEGTLYSVVPNNSNGDFSVTRATTATRVNAAGLVELVPYNLVTWSEQFDNADWGKINSTISANTTTAPNGTITADKFVENNGAGAKWVYYTPTLSIGSSYTYSVYAKKGERDFLYINAFSAGSNITWFNLNTGTIGTSQSGTPSIESVGNGWYRCSVTITSLSGTQFHLLGVSNADNVEVYSGNGTSGIFIWGAQLNEGTALDYFATETRLNIPRLDYSLGSCPNILLEPQRTNLVTYSSSFDDSSWVKEALTITANTTESPSGIQNADTLIGNGINTSHYIYNSGYSVVSGNTYTISTYAKKNTNNFIQLQGFTPAFGVDVWANFDLNNGIVGSIGSSTTAKIEDVGNGWYRCSITGTAILTTGTVDILFLVTSATSIRSETNTLSTSVNLWGFQSELGSYPTSYIPTTSASVTRNQDVISKTGISSLLNPSEMTLFVESKGFVNDISNRYIQISNGTDTSNAYINFGNNQIILGTTSGVTQFSRGVSVNPSNNNKIALSWKSGSIFCFINGIRYNLGLATGTGNGIPTALDRINFSLWWGGEPFYGNIKTLAIWNTQLTDGEMSMLTSGVYTPALAYAQLGLVSESPACLDSSINALL